MSKWFREREDLKWLMSVRNLWCLVLLGRPSTEPRQEVYSNQELLVLLAFMISREYITGDIRVTLVKMSRVHSLKAAVCSRALLGAGFL